MRNRNNTALVAGVLIILTAGVAFYVSWRERHALTLSPNFSSKEMLAEVDKPTTGNGLPVKVGEGRLFPYITVTRLDSNELVRAYSTCAPKPTPPTAKTVACWEGRKLATIKEAQRSDAGTSIQEIDKMLEAVQHLLDTDLNKRTTIDGLSAYVIPGGRDTNPGITLVEGIEMKCLGDKATPNKPGAVTPIGRQATFPTVLFDHAPRDLIAELEKMKKDNAETNATIEPKLASDNIKLTNGENISLGKTAISLHTALSGKHIGVTQAMLNKHYRTLVDAKVPLFFQAYLARDKNGNPINCTKDVSWGVKLILKPLKLGGPFFRVNLKIDDLGYTKVCIPDASLLALIKKDIQAHVERLQTLRAGHEERKKTLEIKLAEAKKAVNYNCY